MTKPQLKTALLDVSISAAVVHRKLEKLQEDYDALNRILDVTIQERDEWKRMAKEMDKKCQDILTSRESSQG